MRITLVALLSGAESSASFMGMSSCAKSLQGLCSGKFDYVCDVTVPWLHHKRSTGKWADATPPEGTGCHSYVFLQGEEPDCEVGSACPSCERPGGNPVKTVKVQGGSCDSC
mmetsp:Transcript_53479/g.117387  ORF Transcript_53479/g.117387 Transcript_53479/m.117387 type:complete len:111 (+) Transcript_53479:57-389(+)